MGCLVSGTSCYASAVTLRTLIVDWTVGVAEAKPLTFPSPLFRLTRPELLLMGLIRTIRFIR